MTISRREFSKLIAWAALGPTVAGAETDHPVNGVQPEIRLQPFNYSGVRLLEGPLKQQFETARDTYYNIPNDSFLVGFRQRKGLPAPGVGLDGWYGTDHYNAFGQYLGGMSRMAKSTGDGPLRDKAVFLMHEWGKTIEQDGYFFYSRKPNVTHYTYEKMIGGLNDIYEYTGDKEALTYLDRITDWAMKNLDRSRPNPSPTSFNAGGAEWYTLSENLYRAYLNTGDPKYKQFAEVWHYSKYWNDYADGHPNADFLHAYSHVNTLSSAAMAYRVSGDPVYLRAIVNAYDYLQQTQCYATGGFGPGERLLPADGALGASLEAEENTFETPCGTWAGFKLSRYLMGFTGEARYGDWIERLTYNGIGAALAMTESGKTFYYSDYRLCGGAKVYFRIDWPCCSGTFPQAVADYHNVIYFKGKNGLYINLFVPSEVTWRQGDQDIILRQETLYPESGTVTFTLMLQKSAEFPVTFRVPGWVINQVVVKVNGAVEHVDTRPGTWAGVRRSWKSGDTIELQLPLEFAVVPIDKQHPKRIAVSRGPLVLVRQGQQALNANFSQWKIQDGKPLMFDVDDHTTSHFVPFYRVARGQPYVMYFDLEG